MPTPITHLISSQTPPVPVFASKPRFLDADPELTRDKIDNLLPVNPEMDTFAYIHPVSMCVYMCVCHIGGDSSLVPLPGYWCYHSVQENATVEHADQSE